MEKLIIYKSKKKAVILTITSFLIILASCVLLETTDKNVIGWSLIIISFLTLIFGIGTFFDRKPKIILTDTGITETSTLREEIEWDAILRVDEFFFRGQYFIRLLVDCNYKPDLIFPTWFYRFDRIYAKEGLKALFIRVSFLEISSIRLSQIIQHMINADDKQKALESIL